VTTSTIMAGYYRTHTRQPVQVIVIRTWHVSVTNYHDCF
jgi:hypothetical protein